MRFVNDFISYSEAVVGRWCSERLDQHPSDATVGGELKDASVRPEDNLFELLDRETFLKTDVFEIGPQGVRVIREQHEE
jgi:hypothetical protein